jgi:hypothetical protein
MDSFSSRSHRRHRGRVAPACWLAMLLSCCLSMLSAGFAAHETGNLFSDRSGAPTRLRHAAVAGDMPLSLPVSPRALVSGCSPACAIACNSNCTSNPLRSDQCVGPAATRCAFGWLPSASGQGCVGTSQINQHPQFARVSLIVFCSDRICV